jgi:copper(I)-binding protein
MKRLVVAAALLAVSGLPVLAADVEVSAPFVRAAPMAGGTGAAFLTIVNHGGADRLVAAESGVAKTVELHTHIKDGDIMRMRKVDAIAVPDHGQAELKPGGDHVMLIGLHEALKEGTEVPLTLVFEKAGRIEIKAPVAPMGAMMAPGGQMAPMMGQGHHHGQ